MKIGILSDIHGELEALEKALALLSRLQVDTLICAGDLVDRSPNGDAVVDRIRELNIPCVQGNHDAMAERTQAFLARNRDAGLPIEPLRPDTVDFLRALPVELRFEWEDVSLYMTHENPMHDPSKFLYPNASRPLFEAAAFAANAQIVILRHTHTPMQVHIYDMKLINSGSVYANRGPYEQTCGVLHLPERRFALWGIETGQELPLEPVRL